jgi:hypothetical protein
MYNPSLYTPHVRLVPSTWIFEHYLGLSQQLCGQTVRLRNPHSGTGRDSLSIYYNRDAGEYRWKCFSTGQGGTAVDYMMREWGKSFTETSRQIKADYTAYRQAGHDSGLRPLSAPSRWQLTDFSVRRWTSDDAAFWPPYNISSTLLDEHLVRPLTAYTMLREPGPAAEKQQEESFTVNGPRIYGYFTQAGDLYKVYQPENARRKFMKITDYVQGFDQLQSHPALLIASSLKDLMALKSLGLRLDIIAPDSETSLLSFERLTALQHERGYAQIITLFDNDAAGICAMQAYRRRYNLPCAYLPLSKDAADAVRDHGPQHVTRQLVPSLHRALESFTGLVLQEEN